MLVDQALRRQVLLHEVRQSAELPELVRVPVPSPPRRGEMADGGKGRSPFGAIGRNPPAEITSNYHHDCLPSEQVFKHQFFGNTKGFAMQEWTN